MRPLLEIRNVTRSYQSNDGRGPRNIVLRNITLNVAAGEFVVIVGCSGSGKSTLMSLLAGLSYPDCGQLYLDGREITGPDTKRGVVFQQYSLLPWLTAYDNVRIAVDQVYAAESPQQQDTRIREAMEMVNLSAAVDKRPAELSGGMRQRVAIARALVTDPQILLLDEPFGALDALTRTTLQGEIERIWRVGHKTVVMVTNDVDEAMLLADRVVVLTASGELAAPIPLTIPRPRTLSDLETNPVARRQRAEIVKLLQRDNSHAPSSLPKIQAAAPREARIRWGGLPTDNHGSTTLRLAGVSKSYGTSRGTQSAVRDINFEVRAGEFVSLVGHSGCGKSTVLSMVAGLTGPTIGALSVNGVPVVGPGRERALVFQSHSLLPWQTVEQNVRLGVDAAFGKAAARDRSSIANRAIEMVGLSECRHKRAADLSAGMRQRVGVARALALEPGLLLLDEPFGCLDPATRMELQDVLVELWERARFAALLVTHDVDEALHLSDRILLMTDGPGATIGKVLDVRLPRPRDRGHRADSPSYRALRREMIEFLEDTTSSRHRVSPRHAVNA
jgi:nitrate/nitrite transport system ATP-binding protein